MSEEIRDKINSILLNGQVENNMDYILKCIPEINPMIGFDHKHPYHHLDVWGHTLEAMRHLESFDDLEVDMAVLLHDIGKPSSCKEGEVRHFHGHPEVSYQMSLTILRRLGYDEDFVQNVCYLVKYHDDVIDLSNLDNTYPMLMKRLKVQYADAKAHHPDKVEKRTRVLNDISSKLQSMFNEKSFKTLTKK